MLMQRNLAIDSDQFCTVQILDLCLVSLKYFWFKLSYFFPQNYLDPLYGRMTVAQQDTLSVHEFLYKPVI